MKYPPDPPADLWESLENLEHVVDRVSYRPGWSITFDADMVRGHGLRGPCIAITCNTVDAWHPELDPAEDGPYVTVHYFPVPPQLWTVKVWLRWVFDRVLDVEHHEAAEFFRYQVDRNSPREWRPFQPAHDLGNNAYERIV